MKAHARDAVESLASRWRVVPRQGGEDYPANVSADDLVAVQEYTRAIGASIAYL